MGIGFGLVVFLTIMDIIGSYMWMEASGGVAWGDAYVRAERLYMLMFWSFAYVMIGVLAVVSYIRRSDISETLALGLTPFVLLSAGLEDLLFYLFKWIPLFGTELCWLKPIKISTFVASLMGLECVTGLSLVISVVIGIVLVLVLNYFLYRYRGDNKW